MEHFTPYSSLAGGIVIGLSATLLLLSGRIAGISGIFGGLLPAKSGDILWRALFVAGLVVGAALFPVLGGNLSFLNINPYGFQETSHLILLIVAGLLVGMGTTIGSGCTSGHGICGIGRLSVRSITATIAFMVVAVITVFVVRTATGG
ncbi:MAG: YeeE/YedE family protein [Alphaproteobacteria bacterium]|nr:MAG: YeeE/YedE family protein [Alphaproteobacteria bacterium]